MANYYCNILSEDQRSALNLGDHDDSIECDPEKGDGLYEPKAKGSIQWLRHLNQVDPTLLHARDDRGWLPIHYAAETSDVTAIRFLLNRGADANARIEKHVEKKDDNDKGERGRVLKEELRLGWTPLDILREKNGELNGAFRFLTMYQETEGYTAIDAAHFGDILFLQDLVEMKYGDLLHQVDENGWLVSCRDAADIFILILPLALLCFSKINTYTSLPLFFSVSSSCCSLYMRLRDQDRLKFSRF